MDEAFHPFADTIVALVGQSPVVGDGTSGQRVTMTALEVELPLELDVTRGEGQPLRIGSTPPIYDIRTSFLPSFHRMRLRASLAGHADDV